MSGIKTYLKTYFTILLAGLLLMFSFNLIIDPVNIFRVVDIQGFNHQKPLIAVRGLSRVKSLAIAQGNYDTLILGNSRVFWGLDPVSSAFGNRNVYNAGIESASIYQMKKVLEFAVKNLPLKTVILGLDLSSFSDKRPLTLPDQDFNESIFSSKNIFFANLSSLFALNTLKQSWATLRFNLQGQEFSKYTDRGFLNPNFFQEKDIENFKKIAKVMLKNTYPIRFSYSQETLAYFAQIVQICLEHQIELKLFIEPSHAIALKWAVISQNAPTVRNWKKNIVKILETSDNDNSVTLWDFTGLNTINTEPIPEDSQAKMKWYIDPIHYTKEVGDLIIKKILDNDNQDQDLDFGLILNQDNIDLFMETTRFQLSNYEAPKL